jgi:hypothetical protein
VADESDDCGIDDQVDSDGLDFSRQRFLTFGGSWLAAVIERFVLPPIWQEDLRQRCPHGLTALCGADLRDNKPRPQDLTVSASAPS